MARGDPQLRIRLPESIKMRLTESAAKNYRSLNAEIVSLLDRSLPRQGEKNDDGARSPNYTPSSSEPASVCSAG